VHIMVLLEKELVLFSCPQLSVSSSDGELPLKSRDDDERYKSEKKMDLLLKKYLISLCSHCYSLYESTRRNNTV
jgi:hypothetical protein